MVHRLLDGFPLGYLKSQHKYFGCSVLMLLHSKAINLRLSDAGSPSHYIVFLYFSALITEEGFHISPCYFWNSAFKWVCLSFSPLLFFPLLFTAICKGLLRQPFCLFAFLGDGLDPCLLYSVTNLRP